MSTNVLKRRLRCYRACVFPVLLACPLFANNLTLQISSETAPPGGWAQIKIYSATPQMVAGGRLVMNFDSAVFGEIAGVAVFSAEGDAMGIASVSGRSLDVTISSAAGGIGQLPHLPILTVTVPVLDGVPPGTVSAITLDASPGAGNAPPGAQVPWTDPQKNAYSVTVVPGSVTVGGSLSVRNLVPGGGLLPAGTLVRVNGTGFSAATTANVDGVSVSKVQFAGAEEIDLTLGGAVDLTGKRLVLRNSDGAEFEYFSAISSVPDYGGGGPQPLLSMQTWTSASTTFTERGGLLAVQNPNLTAVDVTLQTISVNSELAGQNTVSILPGALNIYATRATGIAGANGFRVFSSLPVRLLGIGYGPYFFYLPGVVPALPPVQQVTASPAAASFQWQTGTQAPAPVSVSLHATQFNQTLNFHVTPPPAPFTVTPSQSATPATLTVGVNTAGPSAGVYTGNIVVTPDGPNGVVTTIPLSLTVSAASLLSASPQTLTFSGNYPQQLQIASNGNPIGFTVTASDGAGPHWLTVSPSSGMTPANLTVTVDSSKLAEGSYGGQIVIAGPNNALTVPVQLSLSAANFFSFAPAAVTFSVQTGSSTPPAQTVLVYGPSSGAVYSASTSSGGNWLSASPNAGGYPGVVITVNPTGLKAGTYSGVVTLTSPVTPLPARFPVTLAVWDKEPALTVTPSSVTYTVALGDNPNIPAPRTIQVESGGVPLNFTEISPDGMVSGLFATPASVPAPASGIGSLGSSEYDITIAGGSQKAIVPVTTIVTTSPQVPPFIGSVVNAASQTAGSVAPGEILTIFGFGAGPSNTAGFTLDPSGKVANSLNGAQVLFDGRPAPMIFGSAAQANVIVPYEVAGQATTTVALKFGALTSGAWTIPVAATAPGIFTLASSGVGAAAVLNQDNSVNDPSHPAARGSIIQIYATGEGQTTPLGVTGAIIGSDLKTPLLPVKVAIGGQDALVQFAGSAGNAVAGLFQVNAVVPQTVTPGTVVPIAISVGGVASQSGVTIAVQ
jgi:uncharacterized protein (TIGR03437 family)